MKLICCWLTMKRNIITYPSRILECGSTQAKNKYYTWFGRVLLLISKVRKWHISHLSAEHRIHSRTSKIVVLVSPRVPDNAATQIFFSEIHKVVKIIGEKNEIVRFSNNSEDSAYTQISGRRYEWISMKFSMNMQNHPRCCIGYLNQNY